MAAAVASSTSAPLPSTRCGARARARAFVGGAHARACTRSSHSIPPVQKACAKVFQTKRKAFDSKAHAVPDEARALASKAPDKGGAKGGPKPGARAAAAAMAAAAGDDRPVGGGGKPNKWESKSNELRAAMRAAREYKAAIAAGKSGADLPPPPVSSGPDPSLVPCPHCGRSFSDAAAERHIPKCATTRAKVRPRSSPLRRCAHRYTHTPNTHTHTHTYTPPRSPPSCTVALGWQLAPRVRVLPLL